MVDATALDDAGTARASQPESMTPTFQRLQMALVAVRHVWRGKACLTVTGAAYLGVPYQMMPRPPYTAPKGRKNRR